MRTYKNGMYRDMTPEEASDMQKQFVIDTITERTRPLTETEVYRMLISQQINTLTVDDNTAMRMKEFYPEWTSGISYEVGFKVYYKDKLWKVMQTHTSQTGWEPENVTSLWVEICESHDGTQEDPIMYSGNMILENGKFYFQDNEIYLCTRDTMNPVYNRLSELVGLYVEVI